MSYEGSDMRIGTPGFGDEDEGPLGEVRRDGDYGPDGKLKPIRMRTEHLHAESEQLKSEAVEMIDKARLMMVRYQLLQDELDYRR